MPLAGESLLSGNSWHCQFCELDTERDAGVEFWGTAGAQIVSLSCF